MISSKCEISLPSTLEISTTYYTRRRLVTSSKPFGFEDEQGNNERRLGNNQESKDKKMRTNKLEPLGFGRDV